MASSLPASSGYNSLWHGLLKGFDRVLGAAVVDHVLKPDKRGGVKYGLIRHLSEVALGGMASANPQLSNIYTNPH